MESEFSIGDDFVVKKLNKKEFFPLFEKYHDEVFYQDHSLHSNVFYSDDEKNKIKELDRTCFDNPFTLNLAVYDKKEKFVGWSFGWQENSTTYYMCNSGVLNQNRRKGIYSSLLEINIKILKEMGFQLIYSRHNATNNSVLIPKLKAGFIISKMEISDTFGCLIHLHYYTNKTKRKIMDYRCGQVAPDEELKKLFDM